MEAPMGLLIMFGAALTIAGFAGIVWSIYAVQRARRAGLDDAALLSVLGLMLVVVGILLG
jgi:hypothetical protein